MKISLHLSTLHTFPRSPFFASCLIFLLSLGGTVASAQSQAYIDSLVAELPKTKEDTDKVALLSEISYTLNYHNAEEGLRYGKEALRLAEKLQWGKGMADAKLSVGRNYWRLGNFTEALNLHFQSLDLWTKLGDKNKTALLYAIIGQDYADSGNYPEALKHLSLSLTSYEVLDDINQQGYVHSVISWVYGNMGMYPEMLKHQYITLKIAEETGDRYGVAIAYSNLADTYEEQGNYEKAIETYTQCLKIEVEFDDFINVVNGYNHIGFCHKNMGNYAASLSNHFLALETGKKIKNRNSIGEAYSHIGDVYEAQGNNAEALKNFRLAVREFSAVENKHALATLYSKIGGCHTKLGNYDEARKFFNDAYSLTKALESISEYNNYYKGVVKLDSATGNWKNAFEHHKLFVGTRDSMYNEESTKKIVQSRMQYEFDKKEAAAAAEQEKKDALAKQELRRQKLIRNGFVGGFAVVMLFAGVFFYQRNKINKGKKRSDELLLNILPAEVAEELKAKGSADAKLIDEVTVLFSDFKNFTQMSELQTPKALVAEINECFSAFDLIMQKHAVEKIKTVGDAYLAAGGLPTPNKTHATNVLNAALEMQEFMQQRKQKRESTGDFFFEARIGVHTGPVVAGIVGVKKFAYDIWGDTVNTAQRMESSGEAGKVNISGSTFELVKSQFNCTYRGKIETKGKGKVDMYFVES